MGENGEQLFLLEVVVEMINLTPEMGPAPPKKQVHIQIHFGNFVSLEINPDAVGVTDPSEKGGKYHQTIYVFDFILKSKTSSINYILIS